MPSPHASASVARAGQGEWQLLLILRHDHAARLLDGNSAPAVSRDRGDRRHPDAAPFDGLAMPLTAVLAEMRVPVSRVSRLAPGDVLPLAITGQARLRIAGTEIGRGQIGTSDGALALRLTQLAWNAKGIEND